MEKLPSLNATLSRTGSPKSMQLLKSADAESMSRGRKLAARILSNYPDYGKAPPEYLLTLSETLASLTTSEIVWLCDPDDGLATVCKYLPTTADIHDFLKAKRAKAEQFKSARERFGDAGYRYLSDDRGAVVVESSPERRKQVVKELLGYDPMKPTAPKRELVNPTAAEVDITVSSLKTEARPISPEFRAHLEAEGWFEYLESRKQTAAMTRTA